LPWVDKENLVPGHHWELEIQKAVRASNVVIAFISSSGIDRAGYLHKEIGLAIDVAQRQPEGAIYIIPIRLDECEMPQRLSHLHWSSIPRDLVAEIYVTLQSSLLTRASELGLLTADELRNIPRMPAMAKGRSATLRTGRYLVRGRNPDRSKYFGIAGAEESNDKYCVTWNISGRIVNSQGEAPHDPVEYLTGGVHILTQDEYKVVFSSQSGTGIYEGTWGTGGTEQLIPASPMVRGGTGFR
jgi:hypothetical protein